MLKLDKNNPHGVAGKFAIRQKRGKFEYAEFTARHPQTKQLLNASRKKSKVLYQDIRGLLSRPAGPGGNVQHLERPWGSPNLLLPLLVTTCFCHQDALREERRQQRNVYSALSRKTGDLKFGGQKTASFAHKKRWRGRTRKMEGSRTYRGRKRQRKQ